MKYIKAVNHIIRNIRFLAGKVRADENNLDYLKSDREVLNSELSYFQYWLKLEDLPHDPESKK